MVQWTVHLHNAEAETSFRILRRSVFISIIITTTTTAAAIATATFLFIVLGDGVRLIWLKSVVI